MRNLQVAWLFQEMADLLELSGETGFKVVAYRKAARTLEQLPEDIDAIYEAGRLRQIPGIGQALAQKIAEILTRGTFGALEELRAQIPPGLKEFMDIPGLGPKTAAMIYKTLGLSTLTELEEAAREKRLRALPGMGPKKEANILQGIEARKQIGHRVSLAIAWGEAMELLDLLRKHPAVRQAEVAGSIRRRREMVGDIDLVAAAPEGASSAVMQFFTSLPPVAGVQGQGETKASVVLRSGRQVDLRVVAPEVFPCTLHHFTGSKEHNVRLRGMAKDRGLKLNEYGLFREDSGERLPICSEEELYAALGLPYIPPELREDAGEIEAGLEGRLPRKLIEIGHMRGDLHMHSRWSDGVNTVAEMAAAARARGYQYMAISDHSQSLVIAGGLDPASLKKQRQEIQQINAQYDDFRVLRSIEVDILKDGRLDLPDEDLAELDFVTASIHTSLRLDKEQQTARLIAAMRNPHVDAIGHPTGRLLGRREGYEIDVDQVLEVAAETGTALELNASPDRLDLSWTILRRAKEYGVKLVINSDAHSVEGLEAMPWGIGEARRGWVEPDQVLNTRPLEEFLGLIKKG